MAMTSRVSLTVKGSVFSRAMVRVMEVPTAPRISFTASSSGWPTMEEPSMAVM